VTVIEVFADVCCPFTHVGLRRLVAERARLGRDDVLIRVRAWPLELVNSDPLAPDLVGEEIEALRTFVAPDLFAAFDPTHFPSTSLPALGLAAAAYEHGDRTGEGVSLALRTALFEEGRDVADGTELAAIARTFDIEVPRAGDVRCAKADLQEGRRRGVVGSPHFFVGDKGFFCPALSIERVDGHLHATLDADGLATFLTAAFDRASPAIS
jgi:predicted DsbA family dithiol-disulfide isomerase